MKDWFSDAWIARLNAQHGGGRFFRAAIVELIVGSDTRYVADVTDPFTFNSQLYTPLPFRVEGLELTSQRELPRISISVSNITGAISEVLEASSPIGNDIILQLLHEDLLGTVTDVDQIALNILQVTWRPGEIARFQCGLNLGLTDQLPRHVFTRAEYPGIPDTFRRASIL